MRVQELIDSYADWLKKEISFDEIGEYYEITTPFLNHSNDYLQLYIKQENDEIYFTDDCATIQELRANGIQLTNSRKKLLRSILLQYGIELKGDELVARAPIRSFAQKKHMFIQAMIRIDDMFALSRTKVSSYFIDDIQDFFKANDIFYIENAQFTGKSGYSHNYDFVLQRSKNKPERLCQAMNTPNKTNVSSMLFAWDDTKQVRKNQSQLIVLANDINGVSANVVEALAAYDAKLIKWSERNLPQNIELLSA